MKIVYQAQFSLRLRNVIKEVKEFEDTINKYLDNFGTSKKMSIETDYFTAEISVQKELTEEEQYKMSALLEAQVVEVMPKYDIRLKSFGRKSGNVQQSVV